MNSLLHLTVESPIREQIEKLARVTGKPQEVILRDVVKAGLKTYTHIPPKSAQAALDLIEWAEKEQIRSSVTDLSTNHNKYAWEE